MKVFIFNQPSDETATSYWEGCSIDSSLPCVLLVPACVFCMKQFTGRCDLTFQTCSGYLNWLVFQKTHNITMKKGFQYKLVYCPAVLNTISGPVLPVYALRNTSCNWKGIRLLHWKGLRPFTEVIQDKRDTFVALLGFRERPWCRGEKDQTHHHK